MNQKAKDIVTLARNLHACHMHCIDSMDAGCVSLTATELAVDLTRKLWLACANSSSQHKSLNMLTQACQSYVDALQHVSFQPGAITWAQVTSMALKQVGVEVRKLYC